MNHLPIYGMLFLCKNLSVAVTCLLILSPVSSYAQVETWESDEGHQVEAEFIRITGGAVELKKQDGSSIKVPLLRLADASRKRAEILWEKKIPFLPLKVFKMQSYDLRLLNEGKLELQPKFAGMPQGDPIPIQFKGGYIPSGGNWTARPMIQLSDPEISANHLKLKMILKDEINVSIQFEMEMDTLRIGYQVIEPDGVNKGKYQLILSMPEIAKSNLDTKLMEGPFISEPAPFESIKSYLEGVTLRAVSENKSDSLTFLDSPDKINRPQNSITLTDALGPRSKFKVETGKSGYVIHFIYPGKSFWSGYDLYLQKYNDNDPAMGASNEFKLKLTY